MHINIDVKYYDEAQRQLFQVFPNATQLNLLTQAPIVTIAQDELLSYMMFTEQDDNRVGFVTYDDLKGRIQYRLGDIDDYLSFNNNSVQSLVTPGQMMNAHFTERIGVALGLCVINKIHSLTRADWKKIPELRGRSAHPTFDFEVPLASTGTTFIQTENKGSVVANNTLQTGSVQNHYSGDSGIIAKKTYVRQDEARRGITLHSNLFYGTIGVIDNNPNSTAKVWLVDPPELEIGMNPEKYKLVTRLQYYLNEFKNIGVKEAITSAIEKRLKEIENAEHYQKFDNVPIDYKFPKAYHLFMDGKMFAAVDTNEAFGRVFIVRLNERNYAYLNAFPKALMKLIIQQNFKEILNYKYNPDFINDEVQVLMRLRYKDVEETDLPKDFEFRRNETRKYFEATYFGKVYHSDDGRIFGPLDRPAERSKEL